MDIDDTIKQMEAMLDAPLESLESYVGGDGDDNDSDNENVDSDAYSDSDDDEDNLKDPSAAAGGQESFVPPKFDFNLFQTLSKAQSAHGIPLQDYAQYHSYCTKRLHRIRHHRDVRSLLVHSNKYRKSQQKTEASKGDGAKTTTATTKPKKSNKRNGSRHAFNPRPPVADGIIRHEYVLWNLIFQAERAWAVACQLQSSNANTSNNSSNKDGSNKGKSKTKSRILSRLNKAVHWARLLEGAIAAWADEVDTTNAVQTQRNVQEVRSYLMWMLGNQQLQRQEYAAAFRFYNSSRSILLELAKGDTDSADASNKDNKEGDAEAVGAEQLALQDLWTNRADNLLLPLIRFCQYEAKDDELVQTDETLAAVSPKNKKNNKGGITLEFRNHEIALDAYPTLAVLYLKLEKHLVAPSLSSEEGDDDENKDDSGTKNKLSEADFLQFLSDLDDALRWTVQEANRYQNLPDGPAVQAKRRELASLKAFFQYHKLSIQRQHQEDQLEENEQDIFTADPAEMLHVYEALLQNAQAMVDLNHATSQDGNEGAAGEDDEYSPEDDPYWLEAQAHVVRIRAVRCFQLARLYESPVYLPGSTTAQVLALLQQCSRLQKRAVEEVAACDFANNQQQEELYQEQLKQLKMHIQGMMARVRATLFVEQQQAESSASAAASSSSSSKATNRPLWLRLRDLDAGTVLADQDPSPLLMPIPCKPVFYDVAWEHVTDTFASTQLLEEYIVANEPKKPPALSGFLGWFSKSG